MQIPITKRFEEHFEKLKAHPSTISYHNFKLLFPSVLWEILKQACASGCQEFLDFEQQMAVMGLNEIRNIPTSKLGRYLAQGNSGLKDDLAIMDQVFRQDVSQVRFPTGFSGSTGIAEEMKQAFKYELLELARNLRDGTPSTAKKIDTYAKLHFELENLKDKARPMIDSARVDGLHPILSEAEGLEERITLVANSDGAGGSYFAKIDGKTVFIIKPVDEDIGAFNNRKGLGSTQSIEESLEIDSISIYRAPFNDMMMYDLATILGIEESVPETAMGIITNDGFFDVFKSADEKTLSQAIAAGAGPNDEKLCTIQRFVENSAPLWDVYFSLNDQGGSLSSKVDQTDFENLVLLMLLSDERDGHFGNILATVKEVNDQGEKVYGLRKIDSSFSFGSDTMGFGPSMLNMLDNSNLAFSDRALEIIQNMDTNKILNRMRELNYSQGHIDEMQRRIETLQQVATSDVSIKQVCTDFADLAGPKWDFNF